VRIGVVVAAVALAAGCGGAEADSGTIRLAQQAYERAKAAGVDMSRGPCLGVMKPGWVADVAHDPRQDVDDEPENSARRTARARPTTSSSWIPRASSSGLVDNGSRRTSSC
jgi:hypothetical protein